MALPNYALMSEAEFRERYGAGGTSQAANIQSALASATLAIEARVFRLLVSRGSLTEYHTLSSCDRFTELFVSQWPIVSVTTLHESDVFPRVYDGTNVLVAGTDYEIVAPDRLRRLGAGGPRCWRQGSRVVRNVMLAGYKGQDGQPSAAPAVPDDLKHVCFVVAASIFREADRKQFGVSAATDATGNYQRFTGYITPSLDEMLDPYKRREFHRTWEVAA
jgi:hypothetical protein